MGRITTFSNGWSFELWTAENCCRCPLHNAEEAERFPCEIEEALSLAAVTDGTVSEEIAEKLGWPEERPGGYFPCRRRLMIQAEARKRPVFGQLPPFPVAVPNAEGEAEPPEDQRLRVLGAPSLFVWEAIRLLEEEEEEG